MNGLVITVFNRPDVTRKCLASILDADIPEDLLIIIVDDASTDADAISQIKDFHIGGIPIIKIRNEKNSGVRESLRIGFERCFHMGCRIVMNLDNDAIVKKDFVHRLVKLKSGHPGHIVTGFHSVNKNRDGRERHEILSVHDGFCFKKSVGGINFVIERNEYDKYVLPALEMKGNWDHNASILSMADGHPAVCIIGSVVQHLAGASSMNHLEEPDIACDFFSLTLPSVTLTGVDCNHFEWLDNAAKISCTNIQFGKVKLLTSALHFGDNIYGIDHIKSKEEYAEFIVRKLYGYIETDHALIIQHDGYVLNWQAWDDEFLSYDYIGATWAYKDGMNVGNGGFSLRSKKFLEATAAETAIQDIHPEDFFLCRKYRPLLEKKYGLKWAPEEIANRFSIEAFGSRAFPRGAEYSGQFGFHGYSVDFSKASLPHVPSRPAVKIQPPVPQQAPKPEPKKQVIRKTHMFRP